jgi:hypothetical protein
MVTDISVRHISPIFKGPMGAIGCSEGSVTNDQSTLNHITLDRRPQLYC